jgi:hypothetical protein
MSELFSAYAQPRWDMGRVLVHMVLGLVCLAWLSELCPSEARLVFAGGILAWGFAVVGVFLVPKRATMGLAILGALMVGGGTLALTVNDGCGCGAASSPRDMTGESQNFSMHCLY